MFSGGLGSCWALEQFLCRGAAGFHKDMTGSIVLGTQMQHSVVGE